MLVYFVSKRLLISQTAEPIVSRADTKYQRYPLVTNAGNKLWCHNLCSPKYFQPSLCLWLAWSDSSISAPVNVVIFAGCHTYCSYKHTLERKTSFVTTLLFDLLIEKIYSYFTSKHYWYSVFFFFRKIFKFDNDNAVWHNASKHYVWDLLPSVHGFSDGVGAGPAAQPGLRGGVPLRHGHYGRPHHRWVSLPVLSVGRTLSTR